MRTTLMCMLVALLLQTTNAHAQNSTRVAVKLYEHERWVRSYPSTMLHTKVRKVLLLGPITPVAFIEAPQGRFIEVNTICDKSMLQLVEGSWHNKSACKSKEYQYRSSVTVSAAAKP